MRNERPSCFATMPDAEFVEHLQSHGIEPTPEELHPHNLNKSTNAHTYLEEGFEVSILNDSNQMRFGNSASELSSE